VKLSSTSAAYPSDWSHTAHVRGHAAAAMQEDDGGMRSVAARGEELAAQGRRLRFGHGHRDQLPVRAGRGGRRDGEAEQERRDSSHGGPSVDRGQAWRQASSVAGVASLRYGAEAMESIG
jgi:hypothetical protein